MKQLKTLGIFFLCSFLSFSFIHAQTIQGKGSMKTETIEMDEIKGLAIGISANVRVTQGNQQMIKVKAQQNILDILNKEEDGGSWNIGFKKGKKARNYETIEVEITMKELKAVAIGGSGNLMGTNTFDHSDKFAVAIGGSGNINMDVEAEDISIAIGGSGNVLLEGKAEDLSITLSGSGKINTEDLEAEEVSVILSGSGDANVHASEELSVMLSGSGNVIYTGRPKVNSKVSGSGTVSSK